MRPNTLFFGCRTPEESTRKAGFEVCGQVLQMLAVVTVSSEGCVHGCNNKKTLVLEEASTDVVVVAA